MTNNFKVQLRQWLSTKIPTKTSDLTNDSDFVYHNTTYTYTHTNINNELLDENNYTITPLNNNTPSVTFNDNNDIDVRDGYVTYECNPLNKNYEIYLNHVEFYNSPNTIRIITTNSNYDVDTSKGYNTIIISDSGNTTQIYTMDENDNESLYTISGELTSLCFGGDEVCINDISGSCDVANPIIKNDLIDIIYPVGSIYMNTNDVSPASLFGGEWKRLEDCFLLASGRNHAVGGTGGAETVTLTQSQMPSHTHTQDSHNHTQASHSHKPSNTAMKFMITDTNIAVNGTKRAFPSSTNGAYYFVYASAVGNGIGEVSDTNSAQPTINGTTATNQNTGGGQAHNNMPPYLTVSIWERIA